MEYKLCKETFFAKNLDVRKAYEANRYGDHTDDRAFRYLLTARCGHCGTRMISHKSYYRVNDLCFCMACAQYAEDYILECYRDHFIYEE